VHGSAGGREPLPGGAAQLAGEPGDLLLEPAELLLEEGEQQHRRGRDDGGRPPTRAQQGNLAEEIT